MGHNSGDLFELMGDILATARLDDKARFSQMVAETKANMEAGIVGSGHRSGGPWGGGGWVNLSLTNTGVCCGTGGVYVSLHCTPAESPSPAMPLVQDAAVAAQIPPKICDPCLIWPSCPLPPPLIRTHIHTPSVVCVCVTGMLVFALLPSALLLGGSLRPLAGCPTWSSSGHWARGWRRTGRECRYKERGGVTATVHSLIATMVGSVET